MTADEKVKVDAIVVGGGPAGLSAAYTMSKAGLEVIVIERGEYCGAKNVGGLLYGTVLNQMMPRFYEKAPIERPVSKRSIVFLGGGEHASLTFGSEQWTIPPFNNTFIVQRSQFDRWFSGEAEKAGASLLEGTVADELIYESSGRSKKAVGVRVRGNEEFYADVVILADGANCLLSEQVKEAMTIGGGKTQQDFAVGVKEIITLGKGRIEDRFNLNANEGAAIDFIGVPFEGLIGGGFIYTGKEGIHVGFAARIESVVHSRLSPCEIMDGFKRHPVVKRYVEGGELAEYSAHMIPEAGYDAIGDLSAHGVMIAGDAAGLVNMSLYKEGTNHAMESGRTAGETAVMARKKGDFSRATLGEYDSRLRQGAVMKDLKKYKDLPRILETSPNLMSLYPRKMTSMMIDYFTVTSESKKEVQKKAVRNFLRGLPKFRFIRDMIRGRKVA